MFEMFNLLINKYNIKSTLFFFNKKADLVYES